MCKLVNLSWCANGRCTASECFLVVFLFVCCSTLSNTRVLPSGPQTAQADVSLFNKLQPQTGSGPLLIERDAWRGEEEWMMHSQAGKMYIHDDETAPPCGQHIVAGGTRTWVVGGWGTTCVISWLACHWIGSTEKMGGARVASHPTTTTQNKQIKMTFKQTNRQTDKE